MRAFEAADRHLSFNAGRARAARHCRRGTASKCACWRRGWACKLFESVDTAGDPDPRRGSYLTPIRKAVWVVSRGGPARAQGPRASRPWCIWSMAASTSTICAGGSPQFRPGQPQVGARIRQTAGLHECSGRHVDVLTSAACGATPGTACRPSGDRFSDRPARHSRLSRESKHCFLPARRRSAVDSVASSTATRLTA